MSEQPDHRDELDGWPLPWPQPSREVLRDLDRPALSWIGPESDPEAWPLRVAA